MLLRLESIRWSRNLGQLIAVECLHDLPQSLMAVILMVPHILVVLHLSFIVKRQGYETVDGLREFRYFWGVLLLHLETKLFGLRENYLSLQRL